MGHGHGRPNEASAGGRHVRRLWISLGVLLAFLAIEVVVGLATSSLALLSDAGHMFTDVAAIGLSVLAIRFAAKAPTPERTFGSVTLQLGKEAGMWASRMREFRNG